MSACSKSPPDLGKATRTRICSMAARPDDSITHAYVGKYQDRVRSCPLRPTAENPGDGNPKSPKQHSTAKTRPRPLGQARRWFPRERASS
jgi:hypothetical protein